MQGTSRSTCPSERITINAQDKPTSASAMLKYCTLHQICGFMQLLYFALDKNGRKETTISNQSVGSNTRCVRCLQWPLDNQLQVANPNVMITNTPQMLSAARSVRFDMRITLPNRLVVMQMTMRLVCGGGALNA